MGLLEIAALLGAIAASIIALTVISRSLLGIYKFLRRIDDTTKIVKELPAWQDKINVGMKELHPNSGTSLKDQVTAINDKLCETERKVDTLGNSLDDIRDMLQSHVADNQIHSQ